VKIGVEYNTYEALTQHPEIIKMIESIVQSVNEQVSRTEPRMRD